MMRSKVIAVMAVIVIALLSAPGLAAEPATRSAAEALNGVSSYGQMLTRMLIVLGCIVVALVVAAKALPRIAPRLVNKYSRPGAQRLIEVLDAQPLDRFGRLYVVRVEGQRFLIASGERGTTLLGELNGAGADETGRQATAAEQRTFSEVLKATDGPGR